MTVVTIVAVVVAGMIAVSVSVAVVVLEMMETGSSQGHRWDFCTDRLNNIPNSLSPSPLQLLRFSTVFD